MVWFKAHDKLHAEKGPRQAGKAAMGVWLLAGTWCADNLTDGFLPASQLPVWGTRGDAARLVAAGLWEASEVDGEAGWSFVDWGRDQPTRAKVLAVREARAKAGREGGMKSGASRRRAKPPAKTKQVASLVGSPGLEAKDELPNPYLLAANAASASGGSAPPIAAPPEITDDPPQRATPAGSSASQIIVGEWLATRPQRPPEQVVGQVAKHVHAMLTQSQPIPPQTVRSGLDLWASRGLHPSALPSCVDQVMAPPRPLATVPTAGAFPAARPSTTDRAVMAGAQLAEMFAGPEDAP